MERLLAEQQFAISAVEQSLQELESIEENYKQLVERLDNLPKKLRHPVTVPLNSVGFFQGELIHTNEITVLLSSEYLVQVSASKASEIAARRIEECRKRQSKAREEIKHFSEWKNFTQQGINEESQAIDIKEEFDEAKEAAWREEHAKRVRQERSRERNSAKEDPEDHQWLERLEELEMLEELEKYSSKNAQHSSNIEELAPAIQSLKLGKDTSEGDSGMPSEASHEPGPSTGETRAPRGILKRTPSTGSFKSVRFDQHATSADEKASTAVDSDDNEEPEPDSDDAEEDDAFTGLIVERDPSGKIVSSVGEAPVRKSLFKASRR